MITLGLADALTIHSGFASPASTVVPAPNGAVPHASTATGVRRIK